MSKRYRYVKIRTKNHTASPLRNIIPSNGKPIVFRMGSKTPTSAIFPGEDSLRVTQINTVEACSNSSDKAIMKALFDLHNVNTAEWCLLSEFVEEYNVPGNMRFPMIIKHVHSSKGKGIYLVNNIEEVDSFVRSHQSEYENDHYIIENYHEYSREYRLHVTNDGCFYTCRKMLKQDATDRWHRHDSNSVWIREENPLFDKPTNWDEIVEHSVRALNAVGLTIGAVDVKCTSSSKRNQKFIILEINSAPAFGEVTLEKYIIKLNEIINNL